MAHNFPTRITFTVDMVGAAFDDDNAVFEVQRIMTEAIARLDSIGVSHAPGELFMLRDYNGNTVGRVKLSHTGESE